MLTFCQKKRSTLLERKMRPRPRLWFWPTQRPCFRVSSSCTLYEVFGNFAWRSAPPRKRVTQSEKAPALRDREVPPRKRRRGARLRGNGDRGTCLTEGVSFTHISRQATLAKMTSGSERVSLARQNACVLVFRQDTNPNPLERRI